MKNKDRKINLLEGNILKKLIMLSAPLMATSFVNLAYNMTDTAYLGRLGKDAVAGTGAAHFSIWIAFSFAAMAQIGTSIYAAQEYGSKDFDKLHNTIKNGVLLLLTIITVYTSLINIFSKTIMGFYQLEDSVTELAITYLRIMSFGFIFSLFNSFFSSVYNSLGNSFLPFIANVIGLVLNIVLDPILIFGFGPIPAFGIAGAAIASVFSQFIVFLIILVDILKSKNEIFQSMLKGKVNISNMFQKFKKGFPAGSMSILHSLISMILVRILSGFGTIPVAVFSVGVQIESITWMTTEGFAGGIRAFVGQNFGAKLYLRLQEIIKKSLLTVTTIGLMGSLILIGLRFPLFRLFVPNDIETATVGASYLLIIGFSQLAMAIEIGGNEIFNALGNTKLPAFVSIIMNVLRIPMSLMLVTYFSFYGVWISMTITTILKGAIILGFLYKEYIKIGKM